MPMMFFYFLKIIFNISTSKRSKKYKPHSILAKKKKSKFGETQVETHSQTDSKTSQNNKELHKIKTQLLQQNILLIIFGRKSKDFWKNMI
jgi:N6-adenosine-specific RNA methylase IME4